MTMAETYNPDEVSVIADTAPITGFAGGTPITLARRVDKTTLTVGMRGRAGWTLNADKSGLFTFVLLGSHPDNDVMAALEAADAEFPVMVKDNSGRTLAFARSCRVVKMADKVFGAVDAQDVTWSVLAAELELFTAGN
jgi:hypothetical protein